MNSVLVLMSTYNGEKYLQEQLNSLYNQQGVEVKILVRDDGSSDNTLKILEENSKKNKPMLDQGKHLNVAFGFYELMQKATEYNTDFIAFCDQDDVWDEDKLLIAVEKIKQFDCPALYYSGQRLVDENLNFLENHTLNKNRSDKTRFILSDFAGCTGVFNRFLLNEVVKYKPKYMLMHDTWILRVCLCLGGKIVVDPNPRMNYRQHTHNTLGLGHGLKATIKQVDQYLNKYHIEKLMRELLIGYGQRMIPEYKQISEWVCSYKINKTNKKNLLNKKNIDFCNKGLNFTYWLKVVLNKL